ncbi:MAG TPA: RNA polymerase sigma factor [Sediminibacterium sp.]|nr:RNA polymerase sigma factor [Sediminibacterium sp.]
MQSELELSLDRNTHQLVERCIKGDTAGYRLLYEQYARAMYNTALRIVNNTTDAEDILQEAFTDAFQTLSRFRNQSSFGAWLKKIVVHKSINAVKRGRKKWMEVDLASIEGYVLRDEPEPDESDILYRVDQVRQAISQLPDGYRTVISLHLLEDYSQEEIASVLGISPVTVRTQYLRAKKKLLEFMRKSSSL